MICPDLKNGIIFDNKYNDETKCIEAEVISFDEKTLIVKVLFCDDKYFSRYLDADKIYFGKLIKDLDDFKIWCISSKQMKRGSSQILIQWQRGGHFEFDLDS